MSKVSIIIPIYNTSPYLERCIRSCFEQTHTDLEIIAINDGSTDASKIILNSLKKEDNRLYVIEHKTNLGVSKARLGGIKSSTGDYLYFLDSDDWLEDQAILKSINRLDQDNSDLVISNFSYTDGTTKWPGQQYENNIILKDEYVKEILKNTTDVGLSTKLFKKNLWTITESSIDTSIKFAEDILMLFLYTMNCNKISKIDYSGYNYFKRVGSATDTHALNSAQDILKVTNNMLEILEHNNLTKQYQSHIPVFCANQLAYAIYINKTIYKNTSFNTLHQLALPGINQLKYGPLPILLKAYHKSTTCYLFLYAIYSYLRLTKRFLKYNVIIIISLIIQVVIPVFAQPKQHI